MTAVAFASGQCTGRGGRGCGCAFHARRRAYNRELAREKRAARMTELLRTASTCPKRHGAGVCGGRIRVDVGPRGQTLLVCEACERAARGICRDCSAPVYGAKRKALRCRRHAEIGSSSAMSAKAQEAEKKRQAAERKRERTKQETRRAQFDALSAKLPTSIGGSVNGADWSTLLVDLVMKEVHQDTLRVLAAQLKLTGEKSRTGGMDRYGGAIKRHAATLGAQGRVRLALQLLLAPDLAIPSYISRGPERLAAAAKLAKLDLAKVKVAAAAKPARATKARKR